MAKKNTKQYLYIYHDHDHGDIGVFDSLKKAKDYAEKAWECAPEDEEDYGMKWEECGKGDWSRGEYQRVYTRELNADST